MPKFEILKFQPERDMLNADQVAFKLPVPILSARCLLSRNIQFNNFTDLWLWHQTRVFNPLSLPLAALWLPRARRKRDKGCDLVDAASEVRLSPPRWLDFTCWMIVIQGSSNNVPPFLFQRSSCQA